MGSFFKSKKPRTETTLLEVPYYKKVATRLSDYFTNLIGQPGPKYKGEKVAPLTPRQQRGLNYLDIYSASETPEIINLAQGEIKKTLTDQYNPETSIYYKAFREAARRNLQETQKNIADLAAGAGRYWTGARLREQARAGIDVANALNQILGQLAENERQRRLGIVPTAVNVGRIIEALPATKAQTILSLGDIERQIQQAKLAEDYEEFLRRYYQYPLDIARLATSFQATKPPEFQMIRYPARPSGFTRLLPALAGAALGAINPALMAASSRLMGAGTGALLGLGAPYIIGR